MYIYVKDSVHYTKRNDLEPLNIECIWLSHPLCFLINHSLSLGIFPETWKDAMVCGIYKKEICHLIKYRPFSLFSCLEKVAERVLFKHLYNHLHENGILTHLQSGFIQGDSTTNQLTYLWCVLFTKRRYVTCF